MKKTVRIAILIVGAALLAAGALAQPLGILPEKAPPSALTPKQKVPGQPLPAEIRQRMPAQFAPGFQPKATASTALTVVGTRVEFQPKSAMAAGLAVVGTRTDFQPRSAVAAGLAVVGTRREFQPKSALAAGLTVVGTR